jgi:hypothetical protein
MAKQQFSIFHNHIGNKMIPSIRMEIIDIISRSEPIEAMDLKNKERKSKLLVHSEICRTNPGPHSNNCNFTVTSHVVFSKCN